MSRGPYKILFHIDTSSDACLGAKYNYLTVIRPTHTVNGRRLITCRCDCGNVIEIDPFNWKSGRTKSCGCKTSQLLSEAFSTLEHTPDLDRLRRIYNSMKCRCYNPRVRNYKNYGGRGISICDEWLNDRETFIKWSLSHAYDNSLSIDRIDVNGNYEPGNCRWVTNAVQASNKRPWWETNRRKCLTLNGITKSIIEWCDEYGISTQLFNYRLKTKGMTPEMALSAPKANQGRPCKV